MDAAAATIPESPINRSETVASTVHTVFLLIVLAAVGALGYVSVHRQAVAQNPNRLLIYLPTMAWEWLVVGYIYWGLRRH